MKLCPHDVPCNEKCIACPPLPQDMFTDRKGNWFFGRGRTKDGGGPLSGVERILTTLYQCVDEEYQLMGIIGKTINYFMMNSTGMIFVVKDVRQTFREVTGTEPTFNIWDQKEKN